VTRRKDDPARRQAYADAGVDVEAGQRAVELLRSRLAASPLDVLGGIGGFAAALELPAGYRQPVLVSATDGVGTKTDIARALERFDTIGQDLVAMCADDVVCHGARPLFFLDYVAVGRLQPQRLAQLVGGIAAACGQIGCALVGGETAEHPGVMDEDAFDLAGFCVGIVERDRLIDGSACRAGDVLIGLASSGLHANGYSLVRALIARHDLRLADPLAEVLERRDIEPPPDAAGLSLGDELLRPTTLFSSPVLALRDELAAAGLRLGALAHITGGGLAGNVWRGLPADLGVSIDPHSWPAPAVFRLLAALGGLDGAEMRATFNCGVGMTAVVEPAAVDQAIAALARHGIESWPIGELRGLAEQAGARYREVR
jgi:phosphoribosylformylglycinamidine cyclo-ligase